MWGRQSIWTEQGRALVSKVEGHLVVDAIILDILPGSGRFVTVPWEKHMEAVKLMGMGIPCFIVARSEGGNFWSAPQTGFPVAESNGDGHGEISILYDAKKFVGENICPLMVRP